MLLQGRFFSALLEMVAMPGKNSKYIHSAVTLHVSQQPKRMQKNASVRESVGIAFVRACRRVFVPEFVCVVVCILII